jgi:nucleoside-diphosphate-sugar epimerase
VKKPRRNSDCRRALVTGANGFVGGHLARRLIRDGWEVHCLVRSRRKLGLLAGWKREIILHLHDGTARSLRAIVRAAAPNVVFHLAALFVAEHGPDDVDRLVDSNVRLTAQLAEAMTAAGVTRLVNTGSAWEHFRGDESANLYAATKRAAAEVLRYYSESTPLRVVTLTLFDTYGPDDSRPKLIPGLLAAAKSGRLLSMSPGRQRVDLVHVDDVTSAYLVAADRLFRARIAQRSYEEFAICSGRARTLRQVVEVVARTVVREMPVKWGARPYRKREVMNPWSTGRRLPGWKARIDLQDGLRGL